MTQTTQEMQRTLNEWIMYYKQYINGYHMSEHDISTFLSLNHSIMEQIHRIHNENMLGVGIFKK